MKTRLTLATAALCLGPVCGFAEETPILEPMPADGPAVRIGVGAAFRGGMKLKAKGSGSRTAGTAGSSTSTSGADGAPGKNSESADLSFGYNGGNRTFGSGTTSLGSGTINADGTYTGGDYSAANDDVYFADNRSSTEIVGGKTTSKTTSTPSGGLSWNDDDLDGWGIRFDVEVPLFELSEGTSLSLMAGLRGWWGIDGDCAGSGAGVNYKTTTTTSGASVRTTESFYDVTAPLNLDGRLDLENAEVFQGSTVTYAPVQGSSSSKSSAAFSVARIEAEADLYQIALGASVRFESGRWAVALRPYLLLNDLDAEATRTEVLATAAGKVLGRWSEKEDKSKFAFGVGGELSVECKLYEFWNVWVAGGYEWVDAVEFDVGPQKVEIDPSAWTASIGIACSF